MKRLMKILIILIVVIVIGGFGGFFLWDHYFAPDKAKEKSDPPTIEELVAKSVDTEDITTNFADGGYIKTKFKIITKSDKTAEELKKLQFLVESSIIKSINRMKKEEAAGPDGIVLIETNIKNEINHNLGEDYITEVFMVDELIQSN